MLRRFVLALFASYCLLLHVAAAEQPATATRSSVPSNVPNVVAKFRVARYGDLLLLPVSIRGIEYQFILDTGAMGNVLHEELADKLAPLQRSHKKYPEGTPTMYEFPKATLSGTKLTIEGDAARFDLEQMGRMSGYNIQGILGMDFLDGRVVEIDFDAGSVTFLKSLPQMKATALPLGRDEFRRPTVNIEIQPDALTPFIIDTGMSAPGIGEMTAQMFDALLTEDRIKLAGLPPRVVTVNGVLNARRGEIDVFKLGEFEHQNLRITSGQINAIGLRYLSRYKITLDLIRDRAYFEPGIRFLAAPAYDASGMVVSRLDGKTLVEKVHPDGPAASAGLLVGDVVTHVNGHAVDEHSLFTLRQVLSHPDKTVTLSITRSGQDLQCKLSLKIWQATAR